MKQYEYSRMKMTVRNLRIFHLVVGVTLMVSACGKMNDPAARVVEKYFQALVNKDTISLSTLSCADWKENALLELDSFQAVTVRLDKQTCESASKEGAAIPVNCIGKILVGFDNEEQELDLSLRI